jgi:hypothetical protein
LKIEKLKEEVKNMTSNEFGKLFHHSPNVIQDFPDADDRAAIVGMIFFQDNT